MKRPEPTQQQLLNLWRDVENWIDSHEVRCGESLYQVDAVQEALYALGEAACDHVGYYRDPEDEHAPTAPGDGGAKEGERG